LTFCSRSAVGENIGWASNDGDALGGSTESTVLVVSDANSVLLGEALWVLGSSFSLGEVNSLKNVDGTLDGEGSVLSLDGEGGMSSLSAFAAVGLADLVELSIGNSGEWLNLCHFTSLFEALALTGTETWELSEVAWAFKDGLVIETCTEIGRNLAFVHWILPFSLSKVLCAHLTKALLECWLSVWGSIDSSSEEGDQEDSVASHFIAFLCVIYISPTLLSYLYAVCYYY